MPLTKQNPNANTNYNSQPPQYQPGGQNTDIGVNDPNYPAQDRFRTQGHFSAASAGAGAGGGHPDQPQATEYAAGSNSGYPNQPQNDAQVYNGAAGVPSAIPPMHATDIEGNPIHPALQKTGGMKFVGKLEHAVGAIICDPVLKARGIEKEQQANAIRQQATHLNEAERLEEEALARRDRAVAHGAHPNHRQLGGGAELNQNLQNDDQYGNGSNGLNGGRGIL